MKSTRIPLLALTLILLSLTLAGCGGGGNGSMPKAGTPSPGAPNNGMPNPSGAQSTFAFVNNAQSDNISGFSVSNSIVTAIPGSPFAVASFPVDMARSGNFVFVESTGPNAINPSDFVVTTFKADPSTGALTTSSTLNVANMMGGGSPSKITVDPEGKFLYMSITGPGLGTGANRIVTFSIDANSGALTQVPQATFMPSQPFSAERMVISPNGKFLFAAADIGTGSGFAAPTQGVQPISRDPTTTISMAWR